MRDELQLVLTVKDSVAHQTSLEVDTQRGKGTVLAAEISTHFEPDIHHGSIREPQTERPGISLFAIVPDQVRNGARENEFQGFITLEQLGMTTSGPAQQQATEHNTGTNPLHQPNSNPR
jgi:hypothetical protein